MGCRFVAPLKLFHLRGRLRFPATSKRDIGIRELAAAHATVSTLAPECFLLLLPGFAKLSKLLANSAGVSCGVRRDLNPIVMLSLIFSWGSSTAATQTR